MGPLVCRRHFLAAGAGLGALAVAGEARASGMPTPRSQSGWLIEGPGSPHGNFEMVVGCPPLLLPIAVSGITHLYEDNRAPARPWFQAEQWFDPEFPGPWLGTGLILSSYQNLETVATGVNGQVGHYALFGILGWQLLDVFGQAGASPPAFVQGRIGRTGDFEVIVARAGGGLSHFRRLNDAGGRWVEARRPSTTGRWEGVGLIFSSYGRLELVGVVDGRLVFSWLGAVGQPWSPPQVIADGVRGRPAFIQSTYGGRGNNFEVVCARAGGGLEHWWRDNADPYFRWHGPFLFGRADQVVDDVTMIQSSFNRLEVIARHEGQGLSLYRAAQGRPWEGPFPMGGVPSLVVDDRFDIPSPFAGLGDG